ncbi:MAG: CHAT domain-containing protein, partial [Aquificae bacterium]|nr:CHAT domain-containing protein [Aquificota bacterium]
MEVLNFFIKKEGENRYKLTFNNKSYERQFTSFFKKNLEIIESLEKLGRRLTQEEEHKYSNTLSLIGDEIGLFLFPEGIKEQVKKIFDNAVANDKKITIKISSDDPSVHDIPFELVRFGGEYLVKKPNFYLVRDVPSISHLKREIKGLKEKLKILVILSLPLEEYESSPLDLLEEVDNIYKVLEPEIEKGTVEVYIEDRANTNTIRKILENESFDIVHFTGHGTEGGYLLFEDEHDFKKGKLVSIVEFRNMFKIKQPDLFFLDACLTAKSGYGKPSLAFELYEDFENSHIVANITTVADREATQGARFFYKNLIEKKSLAEVLSDNRISLKNDWWKGVIFTPKPEQVLFNVSEKTELKKEKKIRKIEDAQQLIKEYVYRFEIIRNASQKIEESNTRYLAFYGIGGMGKTYLMKYFSWFYQGRFDNIIYFDLKEENIKTLSDLIRKIIREMAKVKLISAEEYKNLVETIKTTDEEFIIDIVLPEIFEKLKGKTLLILDNLEEIGQDREGLLKDGWREFVEEWNGKPENFLFLATRVKIFKTQREEFENYIVIDEFNRFDVARFIRKLANSEEELNGFIDYLNSHSAEINEFIGYHPLALKLLILNKPADVLEVLNFREIKSLFEFYRQYLQEFKENFKILLLLHNRFSMELVSKLGIDINLIHLLKNRLFVLKEDGKYLNISKIFRSYFRNDREFKLTEEEGYKLWKKLKPLLDNPDFLSSNPEAVLLL